MLRTLSLVAVAALLAACGGSGSPQAEVHALQLQKRSGGYPTLSGYVVNQGAEPIASADIVVTLYDDENQVLEDVMFPVRNVAAGDSARFERRLDLQAGGAKLKFLGVN